MGIAVHLKFQYLDGRVIGSLNKWVDRQIMAVNSEFYNEICLQESGREQLRMTPDSTHMSI